MRLIHTSDWHLGHTLREQSRSDEHEAFLAWLLDQLEGVDALLIAGDVFDSANPTSSAQRRFFRFIAEARRRRPALDVVVIGGNHDSAARLDAPRPLFDHAGVRMVGGLPRRPDRSLDLDRLGVPLHGPDGRVAAWVAAIPFLRPSDLPRVEAGDPLVAGSRPSTAGPRPPPRAPGARPGAPGHGALLPGRHGAVGGQRAQDPGRQPACPPGQPLPGRRGLRRPGAPAPGPAGGAVRRALLRLAPASR
ncbi:MAG: exonuclease subunit SbcD [bacterium]